MDGSKVEEQEKEEREQSGPDRPYCLAGGATPTFFDDANEDDGNQNEPIIVKSDQTVPHESSVVLLPAGAPLLLGGLGALALLRRGKKA